MEIIIFTIENSLYSINVDNIEKIVDNDMDVTPLINESDYLDGMVAFNDTTMKILNLPKVLKHKTEGLPSKLILCEFNDDEFFILVNTIVGFETVESSDIKQFKNSDSLDGLLKINGVIECKKGQGKGHLISIIEEITLPSSS